MAALDVYTKEPCKENVLFGMPNIILTPHIGSAGRETREEMALRTVMNIERFLNNQRPYDVFNPEIYGEAPIKNEVIG